MAHPVASARGFLLCAAGAEAMIPFFDKTDFKTFVPFTFLLIVVPVAARFGKLAGALGTLAGALIFSFFLFQPKLSLAVANSEAKSNLIWMVLIGVILSDLLGKTQARARTKP